MPFLHALGIELLAAALLYLMAHAVHADITVRQALSAYAISLLFSLVAITPSGLGFVEVSLSVLLVSFGVREEHGDRGGARLSRLRVLAAGRARSRQPARSPANPAQVRGR